MKRGSRGAGRSREGPGFSALEVLIAASVIALALLAIASMFPTAYTTVAQSGKQTVAVTLAQQRIEWLRNQGYTSPALTSGTTIEPPIAGYPGYVRTTTIQDDTPTNGVKRVTVTVTTPTGGSVQLTTLIAKGGG